MRVRTGIAAVANFSSTRRSDAPVPSAGDDHGLTLSDAENLQAVARYLADMTSQLESMARGAKFELLAYLLAMARAEAEAAVLEAKIQISEAPGANRQL